MKINEYLTTKNVALMFLILVGLSVSYYFVIFSPQQVQTKRLDEQRDFLLSMKQKCQSVGAKLYDEDVKEMGRNNLFVPEYTYNEGLNTCLYAGGHIVKNGIQRWVKDSYSNKELFFFMKVNDEVLEGGLLCPNCVSNEEFERRKQELFQL